MGFRIAGGEGHEVLVGEAQHPVRRLADLVGGAAVAHGSEPPHPDEDASNRPSAKPPTVLLVVPATSPAPAGPEDGVEATNMPALCSLSLVSCLSHQSRGDSSSTVSSYTSWADANKGRKFALPERQLGIAETVAKLMVPSPSLKGSLYSIPAIIAK